MNGFFDLLHKGLRDNEPFKFQVTREGDRLAVLVTPLLGPAPESLEDEEDGPAAQARAALSMPMLLRMAPAELDMWFGPRLAEFSAARNEIQDPYLALIDGLKDSSKAVRNAAQDKKTAGGKSLPKPKSDGGKSTAAGKPGPADTDADGGADDTTASQQPALPLESAGKNPASIL